ncbi:hypothetical protein MAPG_05663 [Magnaporthiopsis poae ATCC 64411]|uniref:Heterokaryon incompatibility domain-containing protein n=1 Tax=Magnaporthiopsis poae (strain ATCC 64411 / 73-15) TaxID=644358 RepID=A0A0C4E000_MAGP6|nr:hypothetical protein MAPG_05663 [Magnaporthiopsis poae ATCC 64411]
MPACPLAKALRSQVSCCKYGGSSFHTDRGRGLERFIIAEIEVLPNGGTRPEASAHPFRLIDVADESLMRRSEKIHSTIRDAIEPTWRIGKRYLRVDTLCIVQDDPDDKTRLIGRMEDIFDTAPVTVVATAGIDVDAGLRDLSPRAGHLIAPITIAPLPHGTGNDDDLNISPHLAIIPLPALPVRRGAKSRWNSSGWKFQEQSLSRRILYFTADEVCSNCAQLQRREGYDYGD